MTGLFERRCVLQTCLRPCSSALIICETTNCTKSSLSFVLDISVESTELSHSLIVSKLKKASRQIEIVHLAVRRHELITKNYFLSLPGPHIRVFGHEQRFEQI